MKRKIIKINADLCNGCGACAEACHEGAIEMVQGKARLISDQYCDGLGDCLPACPTGAIEIIEREAAEYDEAAVKERMAATEKQKHQDHGLIPCGCPGTMAKKVQREAKDEQKKIDPKNVPAVLSRLSQWPVQLKLVNPNSDYFDGAHLLIAADCTAYAYGNFHEDFIKGRITVIGCPKLDNEDYSKKLTEIFSLHEIKSITVIRMEVPCCTGIFKAVREAMLKSQTIVPYREIVLSAEGEIIQS